MPRLTMSHDTLIRIAAALLSDTERRGGSTDTVDSATIEENTRIIGAINRARARDGMTPLPTQVRGRGDTVTRKYPSPGGTGA